MLQRKTSVRLGAPLGATCNLGPASVLALCNRDAYLAAENQGAYSVHLPEMTSHIACLFKCEARAVRHVRSIFLFVTASSSKLYSTFCILPCSLNCTGENLFVNSVVYTLCTCLFRCSFEKADGSVLLFIRVSVALTMTYTANCRSCAYKSPFINLSCVKVTCIYIL